MKKFMLLVREDLAQVNQQSEEEMQAEIQEFTEWVEGLAKTGNFIEGDPLANEGRYLKNGAVFSDGPFIESKEGVSGYLLIKANDLDHAVTIAKTCPYFKQGGILEIREIMQY